MATCDLVSHEGDATIRGRTGVSLHVKLFSSWRCPFSQRVWIGLEEKAVDYEWIEFEALNKTVAAFDLADPTANITAAVEASDMGDCSGGNSPRLTSSGSGRLQRRQRPAHELRVLHEAFLQCSPKRRVPVLDNDGELVHDPSGLIVLEYIHEVFGGPPLMPSSARRRAQVRFWTRHVDLSVVPHFDRLLSAQDVADRYRARASLSEGLAEFEEAMAPEVDGPFFLGDDFSMVDIALAPWWQRMCSVLRAYRKFDPSAFPRLQVWYEAVQARPSFRKTAVDSERLIEAYSDIATRKDELALVDSAQHQQQQQQLAPLAGGGAVFRRTRFQVVPVTVPPVQVQSRA
eukprot:TRINITY_DN7891_c0_g1_i1.p1 TRINITY_DN7891_c0_g1~~TRINITY_DN7891_c0_g1_i1.p1  ORF type:complete len:375 (-),score=56.91 TRINITY_DN7891_c0_g1_i1:30-1064(-)